MDKYNNDESYQNKKTDKLLDSFMNDDNTRNQLHKYYYLLIVLILLLFIWSLIADMTQTIQIKGQIIPLSPIAKVNHETGGEVISINVKNYDHVGKGQILVTLNSSKILTSLKQYKSKLKVIDGEIFNSAAYLKDNLDILKGTENFDEVANYLNNISDTLSQSAQLTEATKIISDNQDNVIKSQIQTNAIELARLKEEFRVLKEQLKYLDAQRNIFNSLLKSKNISQISAMDYEIKFRDVLISLKKTRADYNAKLKETNELKSKRILAKQDTIKQEYQKLIDFNKDKIDVVSNISQLETSLKLLDIRAPISGIVQGIEIVKGVTVKPGDEILSVIPDDSELVFEARATGQQKGKIDYADKAEVQFDGFNILHYNRTPGTIINISPFTFNNNPLQDDYIKVVVKLQSNEITSGDSRYAIKPGMSGTLYVTTEEQSVFAYIFGPVYDAFYEVSDQKQQVKTTPYS